MLTLWRLQRLLSTVGIVLMSIALSSIYFKVPFSGNYTLVFEVAGITMVASSAGINKEKTFLAVILLVVLVAAIFDPLVWKLHGTNVPHSFLVSIAINGAIFFIAVMSYIISSAIRRKLHPTL